MLNQFSRTQLLLGKESIERLQNARVAVFGIGGVGGYVCEALVRSGLGAFDLIDDDKVCLTNLNRQIIATRKTVGQYKAEVMRERILQINPDAEVNIHKCFVLPENIDDFPFTDYEYVVDTVDTVSAKLALITKCQALTRPLEDMSISCRTHCICPPGTKHKCTERRDIPGSVAFVPSIAGLLIAGEVVKDLTTMRIVKNKRNE